MINREKPGTTKKLYKDQNLQVIFAVTLMAVLGVSSITPAFPKIIDAFSISPQAVGILITIFTVPGLVLTPLSGIMADRFGRKKILIPSLFLFGCAGVACTFAQSYSMLVMFRFLQGIGSASLGSLNVTIIGDLYSGKERGSAMGYNASVLSVGTASYPALGGLLALFGWNYPFLLPVLAIPVGILVIVKLKNPEPISNQSLKNYFIGIWKSMTQQVAGLFLASTMTFIVLYGAFLTYYPILIGKGFEETTLIIGLIMSTMSITTALVSSQLGRLLIHFREKSLIQISFLIYGLSLIIIPFVPNAWSLLLPTILFGVAHGVNIPSIQTLLANLAPIEHRAAFMSANGMVLRLGQTLGPLVSGLLFTHWGIFGVFIGSAAIAILTIFISMATIK